MSDTWVTMGALALGAGIQRGAIDPVDLTQAFLDRAAATPETPRIFARLTPDRALAEAAAARTRAQAGQRLGPLDGVPLSWKDLFDTAGIGTEAGSRLLENRVPDRDAAVLAAATAGGSVCLGKTHMSELAFSGLGLNPMTATPPCVNDPGAVPGGSSSGAAASVAFGLAPAAIGSDTGGSVRIPAAWNDLVGLKTTHGLVSLDGVVPLCPRFDTVGPLTRNVADAAALLALLSGTPAADLRGATLAGTRLAVLRSVAFDDIRPAPQAGFDAALTRLAAAGAQITDITFAPMAEAMDLSPTLFPAEAYGTWKDVIESAPDKMYPPILDRFRGGAAVSAPDYVAAWQRLGSIRTDWAVKMTEFDAVLVPTAPNLPPQIDRLDSDPAYYVTENLLTLRNTRIGNLMGLCGLTLPTGVASTGIMALGLPGRDRALLRLGAAMETAIGL